MYELKALLKLYHSIHIAFYKCPDPTYMVAIHATNDTHTLMHGAHTHAHSHTQIHTHTQTHGQTEHL